MWAAQRRPSDVLPNPFTFPEHPSEVTPSSGGLAQDTELSEVQSWAAGSLVATAMTSSFAEGLTFLGYAYLSLLAQRPEYRRLSEVLALEMTRKWIRLTTDGEQDPRTAAKIKQLGDELERLKVQDAFRRHAEFDGYMGRSHLYLDTGDTDNPEELKTNLGTGSDDASINKMKRGKLRRIKVIEAVWVYPTQYNSNNPLRDDWYVPTRWIVMGTEVHASRLLTLISRPVPDMLKPAYSFGGLSMSQMAKPYVDNWLRIRQAVAETIVGFSTSGVKTNLSTLMQPDGDDLQIRAEFFANCRNNKGLMLLDMDTEDFFSNAIPLGTLDALQAQSQEHMAAVSGIPIVKLLGIQPAGLNASSEGEIRTFYDTIHAMQRNLFDTPLRTVLDFAQLSLWGEIDPTIKHVWVPLYSLDELQAATKRKTDAETDVALIGAGVITNAEARRKLAADPDTPYASLDEDEVPLNAEEVPEAPAEGEGDPTGGPDDDEAPALSELGEEPDPREARRDGPRPRDRGGDGGGRQDRRAGRGRSRGRGTEDGDRGPFDGARDSAEFKESDHPRDDSGKFSHVGGNVVRMHPDDYLQLAVPFGHHGGPVADPDKVDNLAGIGQAGWTSKPMLSAKEGPGGKLQVGLHDGRHRALAAKKNKEMLDVAIVRGKKLARENPDLTDEQIAKRVAKEGLLPELHGMDSDFKESDHPRAPDGKFGSGGGSKAKSLTPPQLRSEKSTLDRLAKYARGQDVTLNLVQHPDHIELRGIFAKNPGSGDGATILKQLNTVADQTGREVRLIAAYQGPETEKVELDPSPANEAAFRKQQDRLVEFYKRHGYEPKGDLDEEDLEIPMVRKPHAGAQDSDFKESEHPRDDDGKFSSSGGGGGGKAAGTQTAHQATKVEGGRRVSATGGPLPPHIAALRIPPAWTDVTYNPDPKANLLVTGKDAKGRRQAVYSLAHSEKQAAAKFARIEELNRKFDGVVAENEKARQSKDAKVRAAADCTMLIMQTGIRPGSEDDTGAEKRAYGATTLEGRHVDVAPDGSVTLRFTGKKGVDLAIPVEDAAVKKMLIARKKKAGASGQLFPISEKNLLDHVHSFDGGGFKTKDFRTLLGTKEAMRAVAERKAPTSEKEYKKAVTEVAREVSRKLGNTPVVALQSYINPSVFAEWRSGL